MATRDRRNAVMLTVVASLLWGTSFPGVKWGLDYVGSDVLFLWLRFIVASAVTLAVVLYLRKFSFHIMREPVMWILGGLNATGFILQYVGLTITTSSKTALLVDINVTAVAIVSYFAFKERLGRLQVAGIVLGMFGVVLVTTDKGLSFDLEELPGDLMVYLAGWSWAFFIVLSKKTLARHSAVEVSSGAIASCTVWLVLPVAYLYFAGTDLSIEPLGWTAILYLGLVCTSAATLLWAMGLEGVSATASATIMLVEVITALVISMGLLGESLRTVALVGGLMVLISIYMVASRIAPSERPGLKPV